MERDPAIYCSDLFHVRIPQYRDLHLYIFSSGLFCHLQKILEETPSDRFELHPALGCIYRSGIPSLDIAKGSPAEMLSVPIQQLACVMVNSPENMTDDQWNLAVRYMPDYARYTPRVSDPVKDTFNSELFAKDPLRFIKLWAEVGIREPVTYAAAFLSTNIGFWNPFMQYPDPGTYLAYIPYNSANLEQVGVSWAGQIFIENKSMIPALDVFL